MLYKHEVDDADVDVTGYRRKVFAGLPALKHQCFSARIIVRTNYALSKAASVADLDPKSHAEALLKSMRDAGIPIQCESTEERSAHFDFVNYIPPQVSLLVVRRVCAGDQYVIAACEDSEPGWGGNALP